MVFIVIIYEPYIEGEPLERDSMSGQIVDTVGPFASEGAAEGWISEWDAHCDAMNEVTMTAKVRDVHRRNQNKQRYYIHRMSSP